MASILSVVTNPFIAFVGVMQFVAAMYSFYHEDWRIGVINLGVGIANIMLATMKG